MEDVLDLYAEAPDPRQPVVCFDESPIQLIAVAPLSLIGVQAVASTEIAASSVTSAQLRVEGVLRLPKITVE